MMLRVSPLLVCLGLLVMLVAQASAWNLNEFFNTLTQDHKEDDHVVCFWNDWEKRDERAHAEKTFNNGRMSHNKKTVGINNGKWYCTYKRAALVELGWALDD